MQLSKILKPTKLNSCEVEKVSSGTCRPAVVVQNYVQVFEKMNKTKKPALITNKTYSNKSETQKQNTGWFQFNID